MTHPNKAPTGRISYHPDELSAATGWSRSKIYKLMRDGDLPYSVIGSRRVILAEHVHELIASCEVREAAEA
ncbi:MAG: helix-turn-helix domain-containing protein [Pseudomonadota bacterium]